MSENKSPIPTDKDAVQSMIKHAESIGLKITELVKIRLNLVFAMDDLNTNGDLSDFGNTVGLVVGEFISDKPGFEKSDFISGIEYGISLKDGSHG